MNNPFYARTFVQSGGRMLSLPLVLPRLLAWLAAGLLSLLMAACGSGSCTGANNEMCQVPGQSGSVTGLSLVAGDIGGSGSVDATGTNARLAAPDGITADSSGNLYVTDTDNHAIRKITPAGVVTTLAGMAGIAGSSDGMGGAARFQSPQGITVDSSGTLYVADTSNHTIRKITPAGDVTTLAGTAGNPGSNDGTGGAAEFQSPYGITADGAGNLYVVDSGNHTIRKIVIATGDVTTLAGTAGNAGSNNGTGGAAQFQNPFGITFDGAGNLYVADTNNHTIRQIVIATGDVTTLAGAAGVTGGNDGTGGAARFVAPRGILFDGAGSLYVADTNNNTIRRIVIATADVTTFAGTAGNFGSSDGTGAAAQFLSPSGITVDASGTLYVTDANNNTIRKITPAGVVTTLAGMAGNAGNSDGTGGAAQFRGPFGVAVDGAGNLYVADTNNHTIRKIVIATGDVVTFAGMAGNTGSSDGTGGAALFDRPRGITFDGAGNLYVADTSNHTIRKIVIATGDVTTLAGTAGVTGGNDGTGGAAEFQSPYGITADGAGNLYVVDSGNHTIRKIVIATGDVTTLAGTAGNAGSNNGTGGAAQFQNPFGITFDGAGNLYVADTNNHTIRQIVIATGDVTTLAGAAGVTGGNDGTGGAARFVAPRGILFDGAGSLYVADTNNNTIRRIVIATADVTTFAGTAGNFGSSDGTGAAAQFLSPSGITVDASGTLYVTDANNNTIRKITPAGVVTTLAGMAGNAGNSDGTGGAAQFRGPFGVAVDGAGNLYVADTNNHTIRKIVIATG
ncbi:MAG: NHL repeat-containing protein, partial [Pseudomonadota bacterium]